MTAFPEKTFPEVVCASNSKAFINTTPPNSKLELDGHDIPDHLTITTGTGVFTRKLWYFNLQTF